jgi:hypothetical protein
VAQPTSQDAVSTGVRLSRQMTAFAVERGFDINAIGNIFEHFRNWNLAMRSYSTNWMRSGPSGSTVRLRYSTSGLTGSTGRHVDPLHEER